jgi:CheY-like chemotaxis protein
MAKRVLVIEDEGSSLDLMARLLAQGHYEPFKAHDGETGLALAMHERPDFVLCDIQMPGMDGFEVVRRLREDPASRATPVIAVTGFCVGSMRERALEAGFDGYVAKPICAETFVAEVEALLGARRKDGVHA